MQPRRLINAVLQHGAWLGYAIDAIATASLIALVARLNVGYVPKFFSIMFPLVLVVLAVSLALALTRRTGKAIVDLLVATTTATATVLVGLAFAGFVPPAPASVYQFRTRANGEAFMHPLPGDLALFRDGFDKMHLASFEDLGVQAGRYSERWRAQLRATGFSEQEAKAIGLMLFTSTLWGFGNVQHPGDVGCISSNETNQWRYRAPTFEVLKQTSIGCCTDYAYALSIALAQSGFENRYALIPGHIVNEAKVDGKWRVLDANTNIFIDAAWNEAGKSATKAAIHVFPHPGTMNGKLHRAVLDDFQNYLVTMVLLHETPVAQIQLGRSPGPKAVSAIKQLY